MKYAIGLNRAEGTRTQSLHPRSPVMLLRWVSRIGLLLLGVLACGAGPAIADGYWTLTKSLPATLKPQAADPNHLESSAEELSDGSVMHFVRAPLPDKGIGVWQTRSMWSQPPAVLVPGQHVHFGGYQIVVRNDFGPNGLSIGTSLNYYYGVSKDPGGPSRILETSVYTTDPIRRPGFSGRATDVLTVPSENTPGNFLWLNVSIDPPRYVKYYQYSWNPGPVPPNVAKGDVTLPVPEPTTVTENQPPTDHGTSPACPDSNPTVLELQICHIEAKSGETIQVPVYLLKTSDLANLNLEIRYNPAVVRVTGPKATKGPLIDNSHVIFESNLGEAGLIRIGFASSVGFTGSGIIAYIPFKIVGAPGSKTTLDIKDTAANTATNARPSFVLRSGEIVVTAAPTPPTPPPPPPPPPPTFTALDALKALQMSVGLLKPDMKYDLDKNGQITSNDARLILLSVVGR